MSIYTIDSEIEKIIAECTDEETGCITAEAEERLKELSAEREQVIDNLACLVKNLRQESDSIKAEAAALNKRATAKANKADRILTMLSNALAGQTFETARNRISYRKSTAVEMVEDEVIDYCSTIEHDELLKYEKPKIDKKALTALLKQGVKIPGAELVERSNIQIK